MKYLATPILEFVIAQPAHKLPVVFTLEECPLPDCSESPEDVLGEVLRLLKEGWIEAYVARGVDGKPRRVEIRYVTHSGRNYLENRNTGGQNSNSAMSLVRWVIAGLFVLGLILFWAFSRTASSQHEGQHLPAVSDLKADKTIPAPEPTPSLEPSATPDMSPAPVASPSPSATPIPKPMASPSPTPRKRVQR